MADAIIDYVQERPKVEKVLPANETLMGVWLNGCDEDDGKWLLANRVPCFIIHELSAKDSRDWVTGSRRVNDFYTGTGVIHMQLAANPLDQLAKRGGNVLRELSQDLGVARASDHEYLPTDRERSAISVQGWKNGVYCNPRVTVALKDIVPATTLKHSSGDLLPPPITSSGRRKWSKWTEEELEDEEFVLVKRGKHYPIPSNMYEYYDRINNRHIFMESPISMPSNYKANPWIFDFQPLHRNASS
ncbi:hypothetical protein CPC08DRAFT_771406 [Agrocybe pediades]|nr:hypothetical protein CPC08DRAFT_771406 [Agrocybe pediades]